MAKANNPNTVAATATVFRKGEDRKAAELRAAGYIVLAPEDAQALRDHIASMADKQPWENRAVLERVAGLADDFYPVCAADNGIGGMCGLPDDGHAEHGQYDRLPGGRLVLRRKRRS